jgi:hypothetical protein
MAIGDTVQAGLMRVDSSPILLAGQAQAKANQAFGDALGGAVEKFYQKKKDKQEREQRERAYREAGLSAEEAKAASGDKELGSLLINKMNADRNFFLAQQEGLIEKEKEKRAADLFDLKREKTESDDLARDNFLKKLFTPVPTGKLNEAGQDELERGSLFLAPTPEAQENFKNELLQDPSLQQTEPVMGMTSNRFMAQFANESPAVQERALAYMQSRQKDAPKPMTPMELAELKKLDLANRKAEFELSNLETPKTNYKAGPTIVEDNIFRALDIIKKSPKTTTGIGSYLSNIPGTDAKSLKERLGSIKANIGFDYLQAMREASPTGGALGNVSDKELQGLQSVFGSLEQSLSAEELTYNLNLLNYTYNNVIHGEGNHNVLDPRKGGNSPQQSANTIDPADLENAIQAKRKLLEQRKMMQQTLDNPNVPNYGPQ